MKLLNYINGRFAEPQSGKWFDNTDPATQTVYSQIPDSDSRDVDAAVAAAEEAFKTWSVMPVKKRSDILLRLVSLIDANLDQLAEAESLDNGKPVWLAKQVDIPRASANFHFYATAALHLNSETHAMENTAINYTLRQPIGVAGCISPWNLPLYL